MTWRHAFVLSGRLIYALLVAGVIVMLSDSDYEWLIGEVEDNRKLTICDIPVPSDYARDIYIPLTAALILVPLIGGIAGSIRARRLSPALWIGAGLLTLWTYRFFFRTLGC